MFEAETLILLNGGGLPSWLPNIASPPDIAFNFTGDQSWSKTSGLSSASSLLTVSRASTGYVNDSSGTWTAVTSNLPRISNLGLLVEEARTNSIRNNSMAGAVVMADGVELLTNGNFASQGSGWTVGTAGGGSVVFGVGSVAITGDGTTFNNYISQQINGLVSGRSYVVTELAGTSGAGLVMSVGTTAGGVDIVANTATTVNGGGSPNSDRIAFTAPVGGSVWVSFKRQPASAITINQVSVQDGERVQNGGFTSNPLNASQNTVQNGWQWKLAPASGSSNVIYNSGDPSVSLLSDGTNQPTLGQGIPTVAGFTYTVTVTNDTGGTIVVGSSPFAQNILATGLGSGANQKFQFTATGSTSYVTFYRIASGTTKIFSVSVQSAGALPTNWTFGSAGFFLQVVNVGVVSGVNVVDLRIFGTSTGQFPAINIDGLGTISSSYGQTWTASTFDARIAAVDVVNVSGQVVQTTNQSGAFRFTSYNANLTSSLVRGSGSQTLTTAADTGIAMKYAITMSGASGLTMDQTIRIGWPQLENNSLINSTVASAATAASGASGVNGSAVYSVGGGTGTAATLNVTWAAGVMTVNSVASAGSYTVFPPSPAALTYVSGTATGWTGATVNLTPTNNAANAFATSPIVTTSSAATRAADVVTMISPPAFGSALTTFVQVNPEAPNSYNLPQYAMAITDGTNANMFLIYKNSTTGVGVANLTGGTGLTLTSGTFTQNTNAKLAFAGAAGDQALCFNGGTVAVGSVATLPSGFNSVVLGNRNDASRSINGFLSQAAIWASKRVPNAQLQSMTQ